MKSLKIAFVCHGNICRSPMAEFIFRKMLQEHRLDDRVTVDSFATSDEEIWGGVGNPVYPPAREELARHGVSCKGKRACQLRREDAEAYDLFLGMDSANIRNMHRILGEAARGKIKRLLDYTGEGGDVADPWYTDRFDVAYEDILRGCEGLLQHLMKEAEA